MHLKRTLFTLVGVTLAGLALAASSFAATPTNSVAPSISGYAHVGYTLTAVKGTWAGASTYAYKWQTSTDGGTTWTDITGATKSSYKPVVGDATNKVRLSVVATSSKKEASSAVNSTAVTIGNSAPTSVTAPALTIAYNHVGYAFKASAGTWDAPSPSVKYQWQQCDSAGSNCVDIAKATGSSYTPVTADAGKKLKVGVTPTNTLKQAAATPTYSAASAAVGNAVPSNSVVPGITGYAHGGYSLTADAGTWDAPKPSAKYQWQLCDGSGANCVNIDKATSASYKLPDADATKTVKVVATVTNASKQTATATSAASSVIGVAVPAKVTAPAITGDAYVGRTLTAGVGVWDAPKPSVTYQWQLCTDHTDLSTCSNITGATKSTYKLLVAQAGDYLRVGEIATNVEKQASVAAYSALSGAVSGSQSKPTAGTPTVDNTTPVTGDVLTASAGSWGGSPSATFTYQWLRCATTTPAGANKTTGCTSISKATASTYTVVEADSGKKIRVTVKGANFVGSVSATSDATTAVDATPTSAPSNTVAPTITGTLTVGSTLTANHGTWSLNPTSYFYFWDRCDNAGANCLAMGVTTQTYVLQAGDANHTFYVSVGAHNGFGDSSSVQSATTSVVSAAGVAPSFTSGGGLSLNSSSYTTGAPADADVLDVAHGTWAGLPGADVHLQVAGVRRRRQRQRRPDVVHRHLGRHQLELHGGRDRRLALRRVRRRGRHRHERDRQRVAHVRDGHRGRVAPLSITQYRQGGPKGPPCPSLRLIRGFARPITAFGPEGPFPIDAEECPDALQELAGQSSRCDARRAGVCRHGLRGHPDQQRRARRSRATRTSATR